MVLLSACSLFENDDNTLSKTNMDELDIPSDFSYRTSTEVAVTVTCILPSGEALTGIHFALYDAKPENSGILIAQGASQHNGIFSTVISLPTYYDSLTIQGFMMTVTLPIINDAVDLDVLDPPQIENNSVNFANNQSRDISFEFVSSYNSLGIPDNMGSDEISAALLERINASLPEYMPVPSFHPDYLNPDNILNVILEETADVWITFVHEGAGFKNSLGYYTYSIDQGPPVSPDDLIHNIIFPNASIGGDALSTGDKVYLGQFEAGTVVGWFLVQNGWRNGEVSTAKTRFYSNFEYNPEELTVNQQHTILLYDNEEEKLLLAFEDLVRPQGDNDFNDAVFYVTSNPIEAVVTENIMPIDIVDDRDNDGISDIYDDYPDDPDKAFDNFYPAENLFGTIAYEDYWPRQGDYDLNDLVVGYNFHNVHDPQNRLIQIDGSVKIMAVGAGYHNGFAIKMPFAESEIAEFVSEEWCELENDTDKAIVKVFHDAYDLINPPGEGFINTQEEYPYYQPVTVTFSITLNSGLDIDGFDYLPPYNPFLRINGNNYKEVHLSDYPPTLLVDNDYFNTEDDDSNSASGRYYKTIDNLPWAIHLPRPWHHPIEKQEVSWGYLQFADWAESGGNVNDEWYFFEEDRIDEEYIYLPE